MLCRSVSVESLVCVLIDLMEEAYTEQMATPPASVSELMTAICNGQLDRVVQLLDSRVATEDASLVCSL